MGTSWRWDRHALIIGHGKRIVDAVESGEIPRGLLYRLLQLAEGSTERERQPRAARWAHQISRNVPRRGQRPDDFSRIQRREKPHLDAPQVTVHDYVRLCNTVSRATDSAGERGELFEVPYSDLSASDDSEAHLTMFARTTVDGAAVLIEALQMLGRTGYGADASVGHGAFDVEPDLLPCPEFDDVAGADGFIALSTFQPAAGDPVEGFWRVFVKYGKFAPEVHAHAVFKRPQVMLEPGACFRTGNAPKPFYGGLIGPERLLSKDARESLAAAGVHPVQAAFALAVPIVWQDRRNGLADALRTET